MFIETCIFVYEENRTYVLLLVNEFDEQKRLDLAFKKCKTLKNIPKSLISFKSFTLGN